jgi:hypothetical protein
MNLKTPPSLKTEHEELHAQLARAEQSGGAAGKAAKAVANALHPHFLKEEEYALPPLGLLPALASGKISPDMKEVIAMTDRLKVDLEPMHLEHKEIVRFLKALTEAAERERKTEFVHFAEKLALHAKNEEEILYPASILVGEYLKLKLP